MLLAHWAIPVPGYPRFTSIAETSQSISSSWDSYRSLGTYLHLLVNGVDKTNYSWTTLPGKVACRLAKWIPQEDKYAPKYIHRLRDPVSANGDDASYTADGLRPGIKVCGRTMATSASALLASAVNGSKRLTVAAHGWASGENVVYHPSVDSPIGTIEAVFQEKDLSLVSLLRPI